MLKAICSSTFPNNKQVAECFFKWCFPESTDSSIKFHKLSIDWSEHRNIVQTKATRKWRCRVDKNVTHTASPRGVKRLGLVVHTEVFGLKDSILGQNEFWSVEFPSFCMQIASNLPSGSSTKSAFLNHKIRIFQALLGYRLHTGTFVKSIQPGHIKDFLIRKTCELT